MAVSSKRTLLVSAYLPLHKVGNRSSFPKSALLTTLKGDEGTALHMAKKSEVFKVFLSEVVGLVWSAYDKFVYKPSKRTWAFFCGYSFHFPRSAYQLFFLIQTDQILNLEVKLINVFLFVCLLRRLQCFKRKKGTVDPNPKLNCFNGTTLRIRGFSPRAPRDALFISCQYFILLDNTSNEK